MRGLNGLAMFVCRVKSVVPGRVVGALVAAVMLAANLVACGRSAPAPSPTTTHVGLQPVPVPAASGPGRSTSLDTMQVGFDSGSAFKLMAFPPRNEPFAFRQQLETVYQTQLRRSAISTFVDIEGTIVWTQEYLRYRLSGCSHVESVALVMIQIDGRAAAPDCDTNTPFPPRNEMFDFRAASLEAKYRDGLRRTPVQTFVDIEGDIVWTTEYLRYRVSGCDHATATQFVLTQISGAPPSPGCEPPPPTVEEMAPTLAETVGSVLVAALRAGSEPVSSNTTQPGTLVWSLLRLWGPQTLHAQTSGFVARCPRGGNARIMYLGGPGTRITLSNTSVVYSSCGHSFRNRDIFASGTLHATGTWTATKIETKGQLGVFGTPITFDGEVDNQGVYRGTVNGLRVGPRDTPPPPNPTPAPTPSPTPTPGASGNWDGTWDANRTTVPGSTVVCPKDSGTWRATFELVGTALTIRNWSDTFHDNGPFTVTTPLSGRSFSFSIDTGEDRMDFQGSLSADNRNVSGSFVGPVCYLTARYTGQWQGQRKP